MKKNKKQKYTKISQKEEEKTEQKDSNEVNENDSINNINDEVDNVNEIENENENQDEDDNVIEIEENLLLTYFEYYKALAENYTLRFIDCMSSCPNILTIIAISISVILYIISLKGCHETQAECLKKLSEGDIRDIFGLLWKCGLIIAYIIFLALSSYISKLYILLLAVIYSFLCFVYDTGGNLDYHGAYNRAILFAFIGIFVVLVYILHIFARLFQLYPIICLSGMIILIIVTVPLIRQKLFSSCKQWKYGLGESKIDKSSRCEIDIPSICYIDLLDNISDISWLIGDDCTKFTNSDYDLYAEQLKLNNPKFNSTKRIGFPRSEHYNITDRIHTDINYKVLSELFDMDDPSVPDSIKNKTEIIIDYTGNKSKVIIDVKRDEDLAKRRMGIYEKNPNALIAKNFLIIYIDAVSRRHFFRKLPKSVEWLNKYYRQRDSNYTTYQFLKYHSVGYFTVINNIPSFFGKWWMQPGGHFYTKYFKEKGSITGQTISFCGKESFEIPKDEKIYRKRKYEDYDHEMVSLSCDPNYSQVDNPFTLFLGPYSVKRRCLHGKDVHDYTFEYTLDFWKKYEKEPKVFYMNFLDAHESTGEVVKYLDDKLVNFLNEFERMNALNNTVVMLMADHGQNMPGLATMLFNSEDFEIEKYLPFLFLITPKSVSDKYGEILESNEQKVVTPWDLYNSFLNFADTPRQMYNSKGSSIFGKIDDKRFSCSKFLIREDWCKCRSKNGDYDQDDEGELLFAEEDDEDEGDLEGDIEEEIKNFN